MDVNKVPTYSIDSSLFTNVLVSRVCGWRKIVIPSAVLVHVPDVAKGLEWCKRAFPEAVPVYHPSFDFTALDLNGFSLEIVQADEKVGTGKYGTVIYWSVGNLSAALTRLFPEVSSVVSSVD